MRRIHWIVLLLLCLITGGVDMGIVETMFAAEAVRPQLSVVTPLLLTPADPVVGETVTATYTVRNDGATAITLQKLGVGGRGPNCADWDCTDYEDYPFRENVSLAVGASYSYSGQRVYDEKGSRFSQISVLSDDWHLYGAIFNHYVATPQSKLSVTNALTLTPSNPATGEMVTAEFTVRNDSDVSMTFTRLGVGGRGPNCADWDCTTHSDFPYDTTVTLGAGQSYSYTGQRRFDAAGDYFWQISSQLDDWWLHGDQVNRSLAAGVIVSQNLVITPLNRSTDELLTATFSLKNVSSSVVTYERVTAGVRGPNCTAGDWGCTNKVDFPYEVDIRLEPGETKQFTSWRMMPEAGTYFAQIWVEGLPGEWRKLSNQVDLSVSQGSSLPPRHDEPLIGVHFHATWEQAVDDARLELAASAGIDIVRVGVSWRMLERQPDVWHAWSISALDAVVDSANRMGMQVYFIMMQPPCWASSDPNKICNANGDDTPEWDQAYPPRQNDEYADALVKLIDLFGDRVKVYEVWNEPNLDRFWMPEPNASAYTGLLQRSYTAAKAARSDITILGGSLAGTDLAYLNGMYEAGVAGSFDGLALHPYSNGAPDECENSSWAFACGVDSVRLMMASYGDVKPIWFTEFGWNTGNDAERSVTEAEQKQYFIEALDIVDGWSDVPVVTWYNLVDSLGNDGVGVDDDIEHYFGLFDSDYRPKPIVLWLRQRAFPNQVFVPIVLK